MTYENTHNRKKLRVLFKDDQKSKHPSLPGMKLGRYHTSLGDTFGLDVDHPDLVYISRIFSTDNCIDDLRVYEADNVIIGGTGHDIKSRLPDEIEFLKPLYDLYPDIDYSLGYTSRGCIRNCGFCIVRQKEGTMKRWQHPKYFHDERFDKIRLYDNNILADKEWFFEVTDWILDNDLKVDFNQGLDIRLLDVDIVKRLRDLKLWGVLNFAWDFMETEKDIMRGIELLQNEGFDLRQKIGFYVLVNFCTDHEEDWYRCEKLRSMGTNAYVMKYNMQGDYFTKKLARWANARAAYWSCNFIDYDKNSPEIIEEVKSFKMKVKA